MINETISNIIERGMETHHPSEKDAAIWGIADLTGGRLSPGELQDILADYFEEKE